MPEISVVIPTFNRADTVGRAIHSVLVNGHDDLEVIVVDDTSTDRTSDVIEAIADERLRYVRLPEKRNGNVARNRGVELALAPVVAFLDSDDVFLPGRPDRLARFFRAHPDVHATLDGFSVIKGRRQELVLQPQATFPPAQLADLLLSHALPLTCSAIAVRRSMLTVMGGLNPHLLRHQDRDLLLRLSSACVIAFGSGSDVIKHQQPDSVSRRSDGYVESLDALLARHTNLLDQRHGDILGYLAVRDVTKQIIHGRFVSAVSEIRALSRSHRQCLPYGFFQSILRYSAGRRARRQLAKAAFAASAAPSSCARQDKDGIR
jgi:glycosyltransferase involved in cell wall biosynthesis